MRIKYVLLAMLSLFLWYGGLHPSEVHAKPSDKEKMTLLEAIEKISQEYDVYFTFDMTLVSKVEVQYEQSLYSSAEDAISRILKGTGLKYQFYDRRFVILYKDDASGLESLKKMSKHLNGLISEGEKEIAAAKKNDLFATTKLPTQSVLKTIPPVAFSVEGTVTNQEGEPLVGVTVQVKGSAKATTTDTKGHFTLNDIEVNAVLVFSYVGFETQEIKVGGQVNLKIILVSADQALGEVVVVGYGTQKKENLTGSVATVNGNEIVKASATNLSNSLAGRLPGLIAINGNGKPGAGSQILIRGVSTFGDNSALVVVDGIVRGFDQIDPNEIESISILKDASATAVYGSRAANGVILVTTKRGRMGRPTFDYNGFVGIQNPTVYPRVMNGYEYATTYNAAQQNMGLPLRYSDQDLKDIREGKTPETDWYDLTLKKHSLQTQHNLSVNGGTDAIKYFMSVGYLDQNGLYDRLNYKRYTVRSNVDAKINNNLTISVDLDASKRNNNGSSYTPEAIFNDILAAYPFDLTNNPDGTIFYTHEQHPVEEIKTGYNNNTINILQATLQFKQEIPFLEGLSLSGKASFGQQNSNTKLYQVPILMNRQDENGETLEIYPYGGWNGKTALTQRFDEYNTTTLNLALNYKRTFTDHDLSGILLFEQFDAKANNFFGFRTNFPANGLDELSFGGELQKDANGGSFTDGRRSYVARIDYSFKNRYLLEGSFRADGSVAFPTSRKYGFFPAVSAGWRISDESFMKDNEKLNFIDRLKLRASYGVVGNDRNVYAGNVPTFQYQQVYNLSTAIISGGNALSSISPGILPNPVVTWERAAITDIGLDGSLWGNKLGFEVDVFYKRTSNILLSRIRSVPATLGALLPAENYAKVDNKGIEVTLSHQDRIGQLSYFIKINGSFSNNKVILLDEPANIPEYLKQTGKPLGFITGYKAIGFFQTDEEVANSLPQFNGDQKAGDVKYADVTGDGKVDANDQAIISYDNSTPKIMGGLSLGGNFKGFDLAILFQGATKTKKVLSGRARNAQSSNNMFAALLDYWTPENRNAKYPRPWVGENPNNAVTSSLFLRDASYLRLKSIDLGYTLPAIGIINKLHAKSLRIYLSATNVFFIDKMHLFDPEVENTAGVYYPQQRTLNLGINLTF